ncbi:hypothetical protein AGR7A_Lc120854 [Agrobacterium deltaense NCPPB 1641]|uniref:Uncharacterized protein n=1 Tax=Agrobacterium deltaense NCPPB 1641 TaxID=1183425 RepID=A0A1S7U061_9HYPH|nr:hypothetical protein AGR7A_Lc120854 [Agrobacterium deltaense NCPPB 1641]
MQYRLSRWKAFPPPHDKRNVAASPGRRRFAILAAAEVCASREPQAVKAKRQQGHSTAP